VDKEPHAYRHAPSEDGHEATDECPCYYCHGLPAEHEDYVMPEPTVTTIDITPTWSGLLPVLVELATNATTVEAMKSAEGQLQKMASAADKYNRIAKAYNEASERGPLDVSDFLASVTAIMEDKA
jgi:hypothetical protein